MVHKPSYKHEFQKCLLYCNSNMLTHFCISVGCCVSTQESMFVSNGANLHTWFYVKFSARTLHHDQTGEPSQLNSVFLIDSSSSCFSSSYLHGIICKISGKCTEINSDLSVLSRLLFFSTSVGRLSGAWNQLCALLVSQGGF